MMFINEHEWGGLAVRCLTLLPGRGARWQPLRAARGFDLGQVTVGRRIAPLEKQLAPSEIQIVTECAAAIPTNALHLVQEKP